MASRLDTHYKASERESKRSERNQFLYQMIDRLFHEDASFKIAAIEKSTQYDIERLEKILKGYEEYKKRQDRITEARRKYTEQQEKKNAPDLSDLFLKNEESFEASFKGYQRERRRKKYLRVKLFVGLLFLINTGTIFFFVYQSMK